MIHIHLHTSGNTKEATGVEVVCEDALKKKSFPSSDGFVSTALEQLARLAHHAGFRGIASQPSWAADCIIVHHITEIMHTARDPTVMYVQALGIRNFPGATATVRQSFA